MLDEERFLSPYGIRSLSRWHLEHPYVFNVAGQEYKVEYLPAESNTGMFGGNSNWRGPIWFPVNTLIIRALLQYHRYYGDNFKIECPTGSGQWMNLFEVSREIANRMTRIFLPDAQGNRPVYGGAKKFQTDPHWRDHILFYEYFHGDNGAGLGASHQTGWTGLVARMIQYYGSIDAAASLAESGRPASAGVSEDMMTTSDATSKSKPSGAVPRGTTGEPCGVVCEHERSANAGRCRLRRTAIDLALGGGRRSRRLRRSCAAAESAGSALARLRRICADGGAR